MGSQADFKLVGVLVVCAWLSVSCGNGVDFSKGVESEADSCLLLDCGPGGTSKTVTEEFEQGDQAGKVDILFVVDNSPSMATEQRMLGSRFRSFISALNNVDWQMGFTTTDTSNGRWGLKGSLLDLEGRAGERVLRSTTPQASRVFENTVRRSESSCGFSTCPTSDEEPLRASIMAMQKSTHENSELFRDGVNLAIVYISDEDELSTGPSHATQPEQVQQAFSNLWGTTKTFAAYGLIIEPRDMDCLDEKRDEGSTAYYGTHVFELARLTKGLTGSLCQSDYSRTLEEISRQVRQLVDSFELSEEPDLIESVTMTPAQNIAWRVEGKKLKFERAPQKGTKIRIRYKSKN